MIPKPNLRNASTFENPQSTEEVKSDGDEGTTGESNAVKTAADAFGDR